MRAEREERMSDVGLMIHHEYLQRKREIREYKAEYNLRRYHEDHEYRMRVLERARKHYHDPAKHERIKARRRERYHEKKREMLLEMQ
jgi:hypothetical protein